ncbi:MAG: DUF2341 domain-containing protein [Lentisphaerae bacterium]|nr:DUF2341 domain-containing protein [Lentisphaerota bacterium]
MNQRWVLAGFAMLVLLASHRPAMGDIAPDWPFAAKIVFTGYTRSSTLTNFPVLVTFSEGRNAFSYSQCVEPGGGDLRFMNAAADTLLSHEIETWDTNGESFVWVRVPELSGPDSAIWALWGNPSETNPPSYTTDGSTWSQGFTEVHHFNEVAGETAHDSSPVGYHSSLMGVPPPAWVSGGAVDGALEFNGGQLVYSDQNLDEVSQPATVSAWARPTTKNGIWPPVFSTDNGGYDWSITHNGGSWNVGVGAVAGATGYWVPGPLVRTNEWQHVAAVFIPGQGTRFYFNGEEFSTDTIGSGGGSDNNIMIGSNPGPPDFGVTRFVGQLDEVSVATVARSANWMWATYMSQGRNATFSPWQRMIANLPVADVAAGSATLNGTMNWLRTAPTGVWLYWGTNDAGVAKGDWGHEVPLGDWGVGALSNAVTFADETTYYYRFYASNGLDEAWAEPAATFISGAVTVEATVPEIDEAGGVPGAFTLRRPASCATEALTLYFTVGGSAGRNEDYLSLGAEVTLAAGETNAVIEVRPLQDSIAAEGPETVTLTLTAGDYVIGAASTATVTIVDTSSEQPRRWAHQMQITFPGYAQPETLTNFPALVVFSEQARPGFRYSQMSSPTGGDLRFMDAAQTRWLNYEIEEWGPGSNSYVWVQVPELAGSGTAIIALWGNPDATNPPAYATNGATWASSHGGVWHFSQPNSRDSCSNANTFTAYDGPVGVAGPVNRGVSFNGANRLQALGSYYEYSGPTTVETWMRSDTTANNRCALGIRGGSTRWSLHQTAGLAGFGLWNNITWTTLAAPWTAGRWYHVVFADAGPSVNKMDIYVDGALAGVINSGFGTAVGEPLVVGTSGTGYGNESWIGSVSEVRISPRRFSAGWVLATWLNQASNATFVSSWPMLANLGATNVTASSADLSGHLYWTSAVPTEVWLYWGTHDAGTVATNWDHVVALGAQSVGPLSVPVSIAPDTSYTYRFFASNAMNEAWADPAAGFAAVPVTVEATGSGSFVVRRPAAASAGELTVNYTLGGTAVSGVDFQPLPGSVTIPAGSRSVAIPVTAIDSFGILRTLVITLAPGGYFVGSPNTATLSLGPNPRWWPYRMAITFTGYVGTETLSNFPAPVVFDETVQGGFHYGAFASSTGGDLRFFDHAESRWLAYEIDEWNPAGRSRVWVQVPQLAGSNTTIWACWGNPQATTPPAYTTNGATWSEKYSLVYHLSETNGTTVRDSTANGFNGILVGSPPRVNDPAMGSGVDLDGLSQYINSTRVASALGVGGANARTGEAWVYVQADPKNPDGSVFSMGNTWQNYSEFTMRQDCQLGIRANWWGALIRASDLPGFTTTPDVTTLGNWMHMAFSYGPGPSKKAYVNGVLKGSVAGVAANTLDTRPLTFGMHYDQDTAKYLDGILAEVRMSTAERSQDWIRASWMSQSAPATFATYGDVIAPPPGVLLMVR